MNRFTSLLRKELTEFARTWKIWVIPGLFIVLAVTGVLSARFAKELMQSLLPAGSDMSTLIPDPTWRDTLGQWTKNLSQIGTIAILLMSGGIINTEGRQGTQILILTKPVSRWDYVLAKFVSTVIFCTATVTVGALVEYAASLIFFHDSRALPLLQLTATWLLYALVLVADPHRVGQLHQHLGCVWPWPRVHACPQPARPLGTGSEVLSRWVGGRPEQDHGGRTCHILVAHLDRACRRRCLRRASRVAVLEARAVSNLTEESTHWQSTQPSRALKRPD